MTRDSSIPGVRYGHVQRFVDSRGSFRELWRASTLDGIDGTLQRIAL